MEEMVIDNKFWIGKRVFITGNTGFKGSWLSILLSNLGANVKGYSLAPKRDCDIFYEAKLVEKFHTDFADITDYRKLNDAIKSFKPDLVFHLAAQPLVRYSYDNPIETYNTNVMGTLNLLEAIRNVNTVQSAIIVTTDKCYENKEWVWAYRENDTLGGHDPYSSSKACVEILTSSYRDAYKNYLSKSPTLISTVRAGNVIGGGDWSDDRLIPDIARSLISNNDILLRNPEMVRPWQHVLEPLIGYMILTEKMCLNGESLEGSWNFGPNLSSCINVESIAMKFLSNINTTSKITSNYPPTDFKHETNFLRLDISKSMSLLNWQPKWDINKTIRNTANWYKNYSSGKDAYELCLKDINEYLT